MRPILLIGQTGQVGLELLRSLSPLGTVIAPNRRELDLADPDSIMSCVRATRPGIIVNAGGFTIVDAAEKDPALAMKLNGVAAGILAECARDCDALLVHFSTTFVFDGTKDSPYLEADPTNPVNAYGRSKLSGEQAILAVGGQHLILRASWVYSHRRSNFALAILRLGRRHDRLSIVEDQSGSPTWARDYAAATAEILRQPDTAREASGIYHLSAASHCTRFQWAMRLMEDASRLGPSPWRWPEIFPTNSTAYPHIAARPLYTVTDNRKIEETFGLRMPSWDARIDPFLRTVDWKGLENT